MERGKRLDKFLSERLPALSRSVLAKFAEEGLVKVDGRAEGKNFRLKEGHKVELELPTLESDDSILPEAIDFEILYEDSDIAIVNKSAGLCVHPAPGHRSGTLVNAMLSKYPQMAFVGSVKRPGVVHRLDLDTSGAIIFALTPFAYSNLVGLIKAREIKREYKAVVHGILPQKHATINMPIGRDPAMRRRFTIFPSVSSISKRAITHYDVIEEYDHASLLSVKLETGRTHQIRVHLNSIGHPVYGDKLYGSKKDTIIERHALHAEKLELVHPRNGKQITVEAPMPEDMNELITILRNR